MFQEDILPGANARTVSLTQLTLDEQLPVWLQEHGERLRRIEAHSPIAMRAPLEDEIERIEEVLEALATLRQAQEVTV